MADPITLRSDWSCSAMMPCCVSYWFMRRADEIRGLLMSAMQAAMGGMSEMLPSAKSSLVRIFIVLHGRAELRLWISGLPGFYTELQPWLGLNAVIVAGRSRWRATRAHI